jgi:hypothetical protein
MARLRTAELFAYPKGVFVVHYACESFNPAEGVGSPRVIAVALRNLGTGQTQSFSIHQEVEVSACPHHLAAQRMDELEYRMLAAFYRFLANNKIARFVHWRMRDDRFGFEHIAHRFKVLGGDKRNIPDIEQFDLQMVLADIYGLTNVPHFLKLAEHNDVSTHGALTGLKEPNAFAEGNFLAVRDSVIKKVDIISQISMLANDNTLRTGASWWVMNFGRAREVAELFKDNPVKAWAGALGAACVVSFTMVMRWLA